MTLSPDELRKLLGSDETNQESICIDLYNNGVEIVKAQKVVTELETKRDVLISLLAETGFPINQIAGVVGLNRHRVAEIVSQMSTRRKVDTSLMDDPPKWFGK